MTQEAIAKKKAAFPSLRLALPLFDRGARPPTVSELIYAILLLYWRESLLLRTLTSMLQSRYDDIPISIISDHYGANAIFIIQEIMGKTYINKPP